MYIYISTPHITDEEKSIFVPSMKNLNYIISQKTSIFIKKYICFFVQDFGEECLSETESDEDNAESGAETTSDTEIEDENDASNEEDWTSSGEAKSDGDVEGFDARAAAVEAALNKLVPGHLEEFEKV